MGIVLDSINRADKSEIFKNNGFIVERDFLDKNYLLEMLEVMQKVFSIQIEELLPFQENLDDGMKALFHQDYRVFKNCGKQVQHLVDVWKLGVSHTLLTYLTKVCEMRFPNICTRPVVMFNNRSLATNDVYHTVPFHQDAKSMDGSDNAVVVWIPLQQTNHDLGPLQVIPSSHKRGVIADEIDDFGFGYVNPDLYDDDDILNLPCSLGDVIFFDSKLIHGSGINHSTHTRWSCQFRYNDLLDTSFIKKGYPNPYLYKPVKDDY